MGWSNQLIRKHINGKKLANKAVSLAGDAVARKLTDFVQDKAVEAIKSGVASDTPLNDKPTRKLHIEAPFLETPIDLIGIRGRELISRLFTFQLELASVQNPITADQIVGKNVSFSMDIGNQNTRTFNGFVSRLGTDGTDADGVCHYRAEIVPWLWFLTQTSDCRIFQKMNAKEIIEAVFQTHSFKDFDFTGVKRSLPKYDYCVQFRETGFNFVSRLLEHEGIAYYFKHDAGKHTMVLCDHQGAYKFCKEKEVEYSSGSRSENRITSWEQSIEYRPGRWVQRDYDYESPSKNLSATSDTLREIGENKRFEIFEYPGLYRELREGEDETEIRMEEEEIQHSVASGGSQCPTFSAGTKFTLKDSEWAAGEAYLLASVSHSASEHDDEPFRYKNTFTCTPFAVPYRPPRLTRKPIVQGLQTAIVTGANGDEVHTDRLGRIKVQFHWDRHSSADDKSSCWIRVAHSWAGNGRGFASIPRVGDEVVVSFLNGDPDRPLITGSVYNGDHAPPYTSEELHTVSGIKSQSTPNGDQSQFNEIRFEDKNGSEELFVHAQKNLTTQVVASEQRSIGGSRTMSVSVNDTQEIGKHRHTEVGQDDFLGATNLTIDLTNNYTLGANGAVEIKAPTITLEAFEKIVLRVAGSELIIDGGSIRSLTGGENQIHGAPVKINC